MFRSLLISCSVSTALRLGAGDVVRRLGQQRPECAGGASALVAEVPQFGWGLRVDLRHGMADQDQSINVSHGHRVRPSGLHDRARR
jgi:hypothetical protein